MGITVIDVFRKLGVEPEPHVTWSVGAAVRDLYLRTHGQLPPKALKTKTIGAGSHCFAIYPAFWEPIIIDAIKRANAVKASQLDLFT